MKIMKATFLLVFAYTNANASHCDTIIVNYKDPFTVIYQDNKEMVIAYRDSDETGQILFGYDVYFNRGKMDSVVYYQDTMSLTILYKRVSDNSWEMKFSNQDSFRYPHNAALNSLMHCGIIGRDKYKFTIQFNGDENAIQSIVQHRNDYTDKIEGIRINFKKGRTRYMSFLSTKGYRGPTIHFNRNGKIKYMYFTDIRIKNKYNYNTVKLCYNFGKLR